MECHCNFEQGSDSFNYSSVNCEESGRLTYISTMEYSNNEGSETASIIINRLNINQAPFFLMVEGVPVRVVAVDCTNCKSTANNNIISPAAARLSAWLVHWWFCYWGNHCSSPHYDRNYVSFTIATITEVYN